MGVWVSRDLREPIQQQTRSVQGLGLIQMAYGATGTCPGGKQM